MTRPPADSAVVVAGATAHVGTALVQGRASGVQTLEFRASIVIGAGSFSFELIRRMVEWLPVIALTDWTDNLAQPIALADVVSSLAVAAEAEVDGSQVFEIGGGEQITYRRLIVDAAIAAALRHET